MAEMLGVVGSVAAMCSCATIISKYALFNRAFNGSADSDLLSEMTSLEASLTSLRHLIETNTEPLLDGDVPETFSKVASQLEDARRRYGIDSIRDCLLTLTQHLPKDPPPTIFILACIIYTFLYMRLREKQHNDQHQDKFILSGVGFGIAAVAYTQEWENVKGYVAWCAIAGLMLSATVHWVVRLELYRAGTSNTEPTEVMRSDLKHEEKGDWKDMA